ncbi:ATP-binding protein [Kocuria nitroreducens]|uniref:ATP-binding protein n=1 Tax=Kocuria nitroreducens TaxID=3058914 RepID=UPI0036DA8716
MTTTDEALFSVPSVEAAAPADQPEPGDEGSAPAQVRRGQWRLARIEVVNWGTFQGRHAVDVARDGFLITGQSGSGKSSLIDAVSAVLVPGGKVRFNAAAQDAGSARGDRSVLSYVRGAWRRSSDADTGEVSADFLRRGATWSGIALTYRDGTGGPPVVLMRYVHVKRGQTALGANSTVFLVLRTEHGLRDFAQFVEKGIDQRNLQAATAGAENLVTPKHSAFLTRYTRLLGVPGEQAVHLMHKTQSAKNLSSLDGLLREFMLDEPATFGLAKKAVADFHELRDAHDAVVTARHQIEVLTVMQEPAERFQSAVRRRDHLDRVLEHLPEYAVRTARELAAAELALQEAELTGTDHRVVATGRARTDGEAALRAAEQLRDDAGGRDVQEIETTIALRRAQLETVRRERADLNAQLDGVALDPVDTEQDLLALQTLAARETTESPAETGVQEALGAAVGANTDARAEVERLERELEAARTSRSNFDHRTLRLRRALTEQLGLSPEDLPFAGELLQVRSEHAGWTGAIERVLRPLSTTLLVPEEHYAALAELVDGQHLGLRLVYQRVPHPVPAQARPASGRSVAGRIDIAPAPAFRAWLEQQLAERYDFVCVDTVGQFWVAGEHDRMVTRAGQVRHPRGRHEKDDRFRVDDRSRWVLGFDNQARRRRLEEELETARRAQEEHQQRLSEAYTRTRTLALRQSLLARVTTIQWSELDEARAERLLTADQERRDELVTGNTDLAAAVQRAAERAAELQRLRGAEGAAEQARATVQARIDRLRSVLERMAPSSSPGALPERQVLKDLEAHFAGGDQELGVDTVDQVRAQVERTVAREQREQSDTVHTARAAFERHADEFRRRWPAVVADLTPTVEDHAGYEAVLHRLVQDNLPRHEERFTELWRAQSQRNIGVLASTVRNASREVRQRIAPVNESLARSPFDVDRFLRIEVRDARSREVTEFLDDLRQINQEVIGLADATTAERQFAVMSRVIDRLGSEDPGDRRWRAHVLDTRLHVAFVGLELDPDGAVVNVHDSSSGLSGGQRQKLVIFCMAAALRYQLTEDDEDVPRFGTVILDEAFDKADHRFTRMAMDVFQEFGFHMVLATPLKLLQVLEHYIGGVVYVSCEDHQRSHLSHVPLEPGGSGAEISRSGGSGARGTRP